MLESGEEEGDARGVVQEEGAEDGPHDIPMSPHSYNIHEQRCIPVRGVRAVEVTGFGAGSEFGGVLGVDGGEVGNVEMTNPALLVVFALLFESKGGGVVVEGEGAGLYKGISAHIHSRRLYHHGVPEGEDEDEFGGDGLGGVARAEDG
jgi:hypothetical protein